MAQISGVKFQQEKRLSMKKYMIIMAAFLLTAGMINAQAATKNSTDHTAARMSKSASTQKITSSTTSVSPATSSTEKNTGSTATIKRKHHTKKNKSMPFSNK
jgi:cytoskeletal protein RodZ